MTQVYSERKRTPSAPDSLGVEPATFRLVLRVFYYLSQRKRPHTNSPKRCFQEYDDDRLSFRSVLHENLKSD